MAKRRERAKRRKPSATSHLPPARGYGFDLGFHVRVAALSDLDFNAALREAGIIGCAYGFYPIDGARVPSLTLVGTNGAAFERAYEHFKQWGCETDGDVVDVTLLLRIDGSYDLWIGPEANRLMYRTIPDPELFEPLLFNVSYIKHIDTTHQIIRDLKQYCRSSLHPVIFSAVLGDPRNLTASMRFQEIAAWKNIVKFELSIVDQRDNPDDRRFHLEERRNRRAPEPEVSAAPNPRELCSNRLKTIDTAFPVSRERVRRSGLTTKVRLIAGFETVSEMQVVQAAINLMLSDVLVPGDKHYRRTKGNLEDTVWKTIRSWVELADGNIRPGDANPIDVAFQIELDVRAALEGLKAGGLRKPFPQIQEQFRRMGCVDD